MKKLLPFFLLCAVLFFSTNNLQARISLLTLSCEFTLASSACVEQHVKVIYTGGAPANATYVWNFGGGIILTGQGQGPYYVKWTSVGMKTVTLHIEWEGQTCTLSKQIHIVPLPQLFHMTGGGSYPAGGAGVNVGLSGSQNDVIYKLFRGSTYTNIYLVGTGFPLDFGKMTEPGNYSCMARVDGSECCREMEGVAVVTIIYPPIPHICMVTFDTLIMHNKIIWNKPEVITIDHYNIYREIHINNEFEKIGEVPANLPCIFIDTVADPFVKSDRYRLSATDSNGVTYEQCPPHKTIHLNISPGVYGFNLIWNHYEGFEYKTYRIYRKFSTGPWSLLDSVASNVDSYTDFYVTSGLCYYYLEAVRLEPCHPEIKSGGYESVISNIAVSAPLGVEEDLINGILIYPNPAHDRLYITISRTCSGLIHYIVFRPDGRAVLESRLEGSKGELDISGLAKGLYILKLTGNDQVVTMKFLKD